MKFIDLNKKEYTFELDTKFKIKSKEECRSQAQYKLGQLLCQVFGRNNIFEDYPLPGTGNLSWDFWIPHRKIAIEWHGRQHFEYVKHFHQSKSGFRAQQNADSRKEQLANLNNVTLIILYDDIFKDWTVEELMTKLVGSI